MTNEEALDYFEHDVEFCKENAISGEYEKDIEADLVAIENTEYRIPKPPVKIRTSGFFKCPVCDKVLNLYEGNYCSSCGQALEWEVLNVQGS